MLKLALKNCLRNKRRTVVTGLSIAVAVLVVVLAMGFMFTCIGGMMENERDFSLGDVRIRTRKYSEYESLMPIRFYVEDYGSLKESVLKVDGVRSVESVAKVYGSLYVDGALKGVSVIGADVGSPYIGDGTIVNEGRLVEDGEKEALATSSFLDEYGLKVGDSMTMVFKTVAGGTNAASLRIVGSVGYCNAELNSPLVVMSSSTLNSILHIDDGALEVHVRLSDGSDVGEMVGILEGVLGNEALEVVDWRDVSAVYPILPLYIAMIGIVVVLFFFIASTLVFNTMMMSTLERRKEMGTMIALGFPRGYVMALLVLEGVAISFVFSSLGAVMGKVLIDVFGSIGLDLTAFGADAVEGWSFPNIIYTNLDGSYYFAVVAVEVVVSAIAGYLATKRVRRLEVAETLREET